MSLAQVQAAVALVVALIASWSGLLVAVATALPAHTDRAESALLRSAKRCFLGGVGVLLISVLGITLLSVPNPLMKLLGQLLLLGGSAALAIGSAGLAQLMGMRIAEMSGARTRFGALVRGSVAFSLGAFFPYIGWFVLAPIAALCAAGAGIAALWPAKLRVVMPLETARAAEGGTAL